MDTVRVIRIIEYVGPRDAVEANLRNSLHGERNGAASKACPGECCVIRAATIGTFPEILETALAFEHSDDEREAAHGS